MKRIETVLNNLGIGSKEVNIYITLVEKGALTARELSEILKIPYTKIYIYLKKLENIGLVEIDTGERPVKFRAAPPAEVYKKLVNRTSDILKSLKPLFDTLQMTYESNYAVLTPTFLTIIRGGERIIDLTEEVIVSSHGEVYLALPFPELVSYRLLAVVIEESKRIPIRILTTENLASKFELPPRIQVKTVGEMFGGGAIGDAVLIYVKYGGELSGVYSNERFLIDIAKTYFNHLWLKARYIYQNE